MKSRKRPPLIVAALVALLLSLATVVAFPGLCGAWCNPGGGGTYDPPPLPPPDFNPEGDGNSDGGPGTAVGPSGPPTPGPKQPGPGAGPHGGGTGGGGRSTGGRGAFTKRSRPATTSANGWEIWWARNRYGFLEFPGVRAGPRGAYTVSASPASETAARRTETTRSRLMEQAISTFRLFLDDESPHLRRASLLGLGRLDDRDSIPGMIPKIGDRADTVRTAAVLGLGLAKGGKAQYALLNVARDTKYARKLVDGEATPALLRGFAVAALALTDTMGAGPTLQEIAADDSCDGAVRAMALEGLGLLGDEGSIRFLADFTRRSRLDARLVGAAAVALGKTGDPVGLPVLLNLLASKHASVQQSAAIALGSLAQKGDRTAVSRLYRCYDRAGNASLKGHALLSIGAIGGLEAEKKLSLVLKRGTSSTLPWACLGLGLALSASPDPEIPDILTDCLEKGGNRSVQGAAAIALGLVGHEESAPRLTSLLKGKGDPTFRGYCALALGMIGNTDALPVLREAVRDSTLPQVNTQAAMALCLLKDDKAIPLLLDMMLGTRSDASRTIAARSLVFLGDEKVVERLLTYVNTTGADEITVMFCIDVVSRLLTNQRIPYLDRVAAGSNFSSEFPIVGTLLGFGV